MATLTISLPASVARQLNLEVHTKGFATRSEFVRSLLRRYFSGELALEEYRPVPLNQVKHELLKTGKYSLKFVNSVIKGLSKSSIYAS